MEQIQRIREMEENLNVSVRAVETLQNALDAFIEIRPRMKALEDYYFSTDWRNDCADDAAGKLPMNLCRGVLSQDAVWNLLTDCKELFETMKAL